MARPTTRLPPRGYPPILIFLKWEENRVENILHRWFDNIIPCLLKKNSIYG
jgi:hypothetical protein